MKLIALSLFASANIGSFAASAASSSGLVQKRTPTLKGQASKADSIVRKLAPGDWSLAHTGGEADFSQAGTGTDGNGTVKSSWNFSLGTNGSFATVLRAGGCGASADEANAKTAVATVCELTESGQCTYEFDKSAMTEANGYYATDGELRLCEIASLSHQGMTIMEVYMNIVVEFTLNGEFNVVTVSMSKASIESSAQDTSLTDYISASNCGTSPLPPNTPLCIQISSSSDDVLVETINEMDIAGTDPSGDSSTLAVIDGGSIQFDAITSLSTTDPSKVVQVTTRVPTNKFNFEATSPSIEVSGSVTVKFAGRRLRVDIDRLLQAADDAETASFDVNVQLTSEPELALEGGEEVMMNSANAAAGKAFAILGMVFASAFALW